ncbi:SWIB/MDM2 domain-containing protein [bacterium]|nr:SWIB/MDM2 domain-containing protein [bacterium]
MSNLENYEEIYKNLHNLKLQITQIQKNIKGVEKVFKRKINFMNKEIQKRKRSGKRKPSGFAVPTKISNKLCDFMDRPHGSEVARTEVTQYIINYIKSNKLQYHKNRKIIKPNKKLKSLLNVPPKEEITYFNLQKYMNQHFLKKKNVLTKNS